MNKLVEILILIDGERIITNGVLHGNKLETYLIFTEEQVKIFADKFNNNIPILYNIFINNNLYKNVLLCELSYNGPNSQIKKYTCIFDLNERKYDDMFIQLEKLNRNL